MAGRAATFLISACCCHAVAASQWLPSWTGIGEHPQPPPMSMRPINLRVTPGGAVFAGIDTVNQSQAHADVLRFESDGAFACGLRRKCTSAGNRAFADKVLTKENRRGAGFSKMPCFHGRGDRI